MSAILYQRWVDVGLYSEKNIHRSIRILICNLLVWLGWMGAFAQFQTTPEPLNVLAQRERSVRSGEPEFTFARMVYTSLGPLGYYKSWNTDWPKSDLQFILGIQRLTNIRVADEGKTLALTDPEIFQYPFLYSVECGHWNLTESEVIALREYLRRGGFLFCDDFWGSREWDIFQQNMSRVLPEARISEIPLSHPVFSSYYNISKLVQIPNVGLAVYSNQTHEQDGFVPHCRGIFDEHDRLMVIINWNTDLGDAWEWADLPGFPAKFSTYAYQVGINAIVYAMSH